MKSSDEEEFVRQFLANEGRVYAFIISLLPNAADADEVFQETGMTLWKKKSDFQPGTNFYAWARTVAHNLILNFRRRCARSPLAFTDEFIDQVAEEQSLQSDQWADRNAAFSQCLEKLSERERQILAQCYQSETTVKSVAERLGRPVDTLYKSLRRIRGALFDCINRTMARQSHA